MRSQNWPRDSEAQLLLHAAGELARRTGLELLHCGSREELGDASPALLEALAEQPPEEVDVLEHAERRIEIAAETLRHVGDAAADLPQVASVSDVLVEHDDLALLNRAHACNQREKR